MTTYDFEGGSSGSAATLVTTGASLINVGAGNTLTHDPAAAQVGSLGLRFSVSNTAVSVVDFNSFTNDRLNAGMLMFKVPAGGFSALSGGLSYLLQFYGGSTGTTSVARLRVADVAGGVQAVTFANAAASQISPTIIDLAPYFGTWMAVRWQIDTGTTNTNASVKLRFYANPFAAVGTFVGTDYSNSAFDIGSAGGTSYPITRVRIGMIGIQSAAKVLDEDYLVVNGGGTLAWVATPSAAAAPDAVAGASDQYPAVGATVTLNTTGSAGSGTLTYAWSFIEWPPGAATPSLSSSTASNPTFVAAAQGRYVAQLIVTQSNGLLASNPATVTIYPHPASSTTDVQVYSVGATQFTNEGGQANLRAALNDSSTATFAMSPDNPAGAVLTVVMNPFNAGAISVLVEGKFLVAGVNRTVGIYRENGTTLLYSETYALTSVEVEREVALDATALGTLGTALADRRALVVKVTDTAA